MACTHYFLKRPVVVSLSRVKIGNSSDNSASLAYVAKFSTTASISRPSNGNVEAQSNVLSGEGRKDFIYPESISPAGTVLRGLNYLKGRDDPISLKEEEYPTWLWGLLEQGKSSGSNSNDDADLFAKSKKLRRKAAKKQRKLDALREASGNLEEVKIPLTQQSIDLPSNEEGTIEGAERAEKIRKELRTAMRSERRKKIKEKNYLTSV